jgi:hypothetical protein
MQQPPEQFLKWYQSLKVVKVNSGPANGTVAAALVVLNRLQEDYNLDFNAHVAEGGMQIKGASGAAVTSILKSFGETRPFAKEGGRTNRGGPAEVKSLLHALGELNLQRIGKGNRNKVLLGMQEYLVNRVKDYHNRQKLKLAFDPSLSTWRIIHNLLVTASSEGKAGSVAQHLVGAKLQLRFPSIKVSNESASTADMPTQRPGDFLIGRAAFHITVAPMPAVFEKCKHNISQGFKPFLLVPDNKLIGARQNADQISQIAVESIESFVSQNIEEISGFDDLIGSIKDLIVIYNARVDAVETDKSLMIELPSNL